MLMHISPHGVTLVRKRQNSSFKVIETSQSFPKTKSYLKKVTEWMAMGGEIRELEDIPPKSWMCCSHDFF